MTSLIYGFPVYSGRTQHQSKHNEKVMLREPPQFDRVTSKRFSSKVLDSKYLYWANSVTTIFQK